ncbi:MAG: DNA polymerase, partial [Actinomycetota bacterium]|nr:DNA polymerase [Actinomycetota bacterium]
AHMSQEPFLIDAFRAGTDIHKATAALVRGIGTDEVTSDMRRVAKTVNFGVLYGMQAFGLARTSDLSRADAQAFIDQYWARLPQVKRFFDELLRFGIVHGYVQTEFGRRRATPDLQSPNGQRRLSAERVAMNMPLQGTAADIMKIAMIRVADKLTASGLRARLLLQVHDELVMEVDRPELDAVCELVKSTMEGAAELRVPLVADVSIGPNWEEMTDMA